MKATFPKNNFLPPKILQVIEKELKFFYFKAFKRRQKNLLTLELIKECYTDQIELFKSEIIEIINNYNSVMSKEQFIHKLFLLKKIEGCNKKIINSLIIYFQKNYNLLKLSPEEIKTLLLFEDV